MTEDLRTLDIEELKNKVEKREKTPTGKLKSTTMRAIKILKILERDNFKCVECGSEEDLTIDHINGRAFAKHNNHQKYKLSECQVLCKECHEEKNAEY